MKKILILTDAWSPQTNGVVTTLKNLVKELRSEYDVLVIHPGMFKSINLNFYKDVSLAIPINIFKMIDDYDPDYIHIVTEGPIGLSGKNYCQIRGKKYNTSFHTNFPHMMKDLFYVPEDITWETMRWFHETSEKILVTNSDIKDTLQEKGFKNNLVVWSRGIDTSKFYFEDTGKKNDKIVLLCVSRVSKEKNLKKFCKLSENDMYECILIGDGPYLDKLKEKYPKVNYVGKIPNGQLREWYSGADVFVFPSLFDTFGVVMIESMACGTPVVAYNVTGPKTIVKNDTNGYLVDIDQSLDNAILQASKLDPLVVSQSSAEYTWKNVANIFIENLTLSSS
jgi:glycosyltransferase involved in cell wall biosynthesis